MQKIISDLLKKMMHNMEGPSSHLLSPESAFYCCWCERAKAASTDSVLGLGYYCCIEGELQDEKLMSFQKKIKIGMKHYLTFPSWKMHLIVVSMGRAQVKSPDFVRG
jgi:hypothetical protein